MTEEIAAPSKLDNEDFEDIFAYFDRVPEVSVEDTTSPVQKTYLANGYYPLENGSIKFYIRKPILARREPRKYVSDYYSIIFTDKKVNIKSRTGTKKKELHYGAYFTKTGKFRTWIKTSKFCNLYPFQDDVFSLLNQWLVNKEKHGSEISKYRFSTGVKSKDRFKFDDKDHLTKDEISKDLMWQHMHPVLADSGISPKTFTIKRHDSLGAYVKYYFGADTKTLRKAFFKYLGDGLVQPTDTSVLITKTKHKLTDEFIYRYLQLPSNGAESATNTQLFLNVLPTNFKFSIDDTIYEKGEKFDYMSLWLDSIRSFVQLVKRFKITLVITTTKVKTLHDDLAKMVQECHEKANKEKYTKPYYMSINIEQDGISIKTPSTIGEVIEWGKKQHHCISGYAESKRCCLFEINYPGQKLIHASFLVRKHAIPEFVEGMDGQQYRTIFDYNQMYHACNQQVDTEVKNHIVELVEEYGNNNPDYSCI